MHILFNGSQLFLQSFKKVVGEITNISAVVQFALDTIQEH
tara:strand:+ start:653 stop:772 length:120 start_codon:yes stop_codon:yes gene_type:complete